MSDPEAIPVPTAPNLPPPVSGLKWKVLAAIAGGMTIFAAGTGFGIYFATHYRIGSLDEVAEESTVPPATVLPVETSPQAATAAGEEPFQLEFTPGERLNYRMDARIGGQGREAQNALPVNLQMRSGFSLFTESVATDGAGSLTLTFDDVQLAGDFMGEPFRMQTGSSGTVMAGSGKPVIDTGQGIGSPANIPQLEFFRTPIKMRVAKNGQITSVSGYKGLEAIFSQLPVMTELEFSNTEVSPQTQWTSDFALPVPGFGEAARARIVNTFLGHQTVNGRQCAVLQQQISSSQASGTLPSAASMPGEAIQFSMPNFLLNGTAMTYFDAATGRLVHNDLKLRITLEIGQAMESRVFERFLGGFGGAIELLPELDDLKSDTGPSGNLIDFNLDVAASVSLAG
ncbi:MAG: hypothetical protein HY706_22445 [Candidatus Hydrogenedentes bacterium]|nr:hypothetical protein [Candidatus Hydrogenedentota bacterium]